MLSFRLSSNYNFLILHYCYVHQGRKNKLKFQLALGTSSSQILFALDNSWFALLMIYLENDLPTQSLAHQASENEKLLALVHVNYR